MVKGLFKPIAVLIFLLILFSLNLHKPNITFASDPTGVWSSTTSLPAQLASHISFTSNDKISIIGGANTVVVPTNISSTINNNGSLLSWNSSGSDLSLFWHSSAIKDNYLYILGGATYPPTVSLNTAYKGVINNQGIVISWTILTPLPKNLSIGASTVVGNRLYFAGGFTNGGSTNQDVYFANINPDGTIGSWTIAGLLPEPMDGFGMVENESNLIIVGGRNSTGNFLNKTYKSALNANGTITGWQQTSSLPEPIHRSGVIKMGTTLLSIGGDNGGNFLDKIYYANINADGTLGPWSLSVNHLPQPVCCGAVASSGNYIYLTGGFNGNYLNTVYFTNIDNNADAILPVPYFSQNALPWGPTEYDHAISLGFKNTTMNRWGCAVTSAAMVLNYHGMTQFQDNTSLNPGSLNQWLKTHKGYLTGGKGNSAYSYLSWPAISKLTKDLFDADKSDTKLMHKRAYPNANTTTLLNDDLNVRKFPDILYVKNASTSGHFVVAKGQVDSTYAINDPEWNVPTLSSFNNSYTQVDRYVPSHTNLSYVVLVVNPEVEILVTDSLGRRTGKYIHDGEVEEFNEIPDATYAFEEPISNPNDHGDIESLGTGVNALLLPEPTEGEYQLLSSSQTTEGYTINIALFDQDGDMVLHKPVGFVGPNQDDFFDIDYSQTDNSNALNIVTFQSTIDDIMQAQNNNLITKDSLVSNLIRILEQTEGNVLDGRLTLALRRLEHFEDTINRSRGDEITESTYQILLYDVNFLKTNL